MGKESMGGAYDMVMHSKHLGLQFLTQNLLSSMPANLKAIFGESQAVFLCFISLLLLLIEMQRNMHLVLFSLSLRGNLPYHILTTGQIGKLGVPSTCPPHILSFLALHLLS